MPDTTGTDATQRAGQRSRPAGARLAVRDALGHRVVPIEKPLFTMGRRSDSDLVLSGSEVSRDHALIAAAGDRFVIRDRESRHGTFVNGERVVERVLAHQDRIEFGGSGTTLTFLIDERAGREDSRASAPGEIRQVAALLASLGAMGSERVLDEVLALVLDAAIEATGAERGFIMLADRSGALEMSVARRAGRAGLEPSGFATSRKIPEEVFATGQLRVIADLLEGGEHGRAVHELSHEWPPLARRAERLGGGAIEHEPRVRARGIHGLHGRARDAGALQAHEEQRQRHVSDVVDDPLRQLHHPHRIVEIPDEGRY